MEGGPQYSEEGGWPGLSRELQSWAWLGLPPLWLPERMPNPGFGCTFNQWC